ncbi:MAG: pantetheine-phosphate adenylyltransferase [Alphaproteobacteria bacterium]|nr:pantetheine-phosphate adenylyltransferase [Alphaproteobacteria bacterium]MBT4085699.1 pantetheine-phosphate adenylyltransferase [Alphaproteobacteria bacterium]MBT4543522.1 pantetheine-phosphate adenylyltransferase [Alphaproteobacteria bacterium]MBT7747233.1 pantetheine-phosphate adenylyltransferase [Alphaproteobacteria bacterium]
MSRKRIAVYPGTFDPITNGHMDIISRATKIADHLIIGMAYNPSKVPMFSLEERTVMVEREIDHLQGKHGCTLEVRTFQNLLMHFVVDAGADIIIRGLRAVSDFEFEFQMTGMNARLDSSVETVFLMASESHQFIASSLVKEIARLDGDINSFVSPFVAESLRKRVIEQK